MRSVELHALPPPTIAWPWRAYIFPTSQSTVRLELHLMVSPTKNHRDDQDSEILIGFDGEPRSVIQRKLPTMTKGGSVIDLGEHNVSNPRLWSPDNPQLHTIEVELNGGIVSERFGLRMFAIDKKKSQLLLNGHPLQLVGLSLIHI